MQALCEQFSDRDALVARLFAELRFVVAATGEKHAALVKAADVTDRKAWSASLQKALKSPYMHEQVVAATDALEERARALNEHMPGEPFGPEHELLPLGRLVLDEWPELATMLQVEWGLAPLDKRALGRVRQAKPSLLAGGPPL